jgi:hypothetical protein
VGVAVVGVLTKAAEVVVRSSKVEIGGTIGFSKALGKAPCIPSPESSMRDVLKFSALTPVVSPIVMLG